MESSNKSFWSNALDVLVTALISAGIAFLQSLLTSHGHSTSPTDLAGSAGAVGMVIRAAKIS